VAKKNEKEHIILNLFVWRVKRLLMSSILTQFPERERYIFNQLRFFLLMFIRMY